jgi:hypothetical protein
MLLGLYLSVMMLDSRAPIRGALPLRRIAHAPYVIAI